MSYFKNRMRELDREYKGKDKQIRIESAGECAMCGRKVGAKFLFGPTHYLKNKIKFKVGLDIHVVDGATMGENKVVLCDGCHMSYHLFNRLEEHAKIGTKTLGETLYKRCKRCGELRGTGHKSCRCCPKCNRGPGKCRHRDTHGRRTATKK